MNIKLPEEKTKAQRVNPKTMVLFGHPKIGKSTLLTGLENCLTLDLEKGSDFLDILKIDIIRESEKMGVLPIVYLKKVINKIKEENKIAKKYIYKYIAIDTVTALEDIVLPLANKMYKDTPMGRNWVGDDVTTLPNGAGL